MILTLLFVSPSVFVDSNDDKDNTAIWKIINRDQKALQESSEKAKRLLKTQKPDEAVNFKENQEASKLSNFQGNWDFNGIVYDEVEDFGICGFNLRLSQKGNKIKGFYFAVAYDGNRIDHDVDERQNISGIVKGNVAIVRFRSYSWGGTGKAKIIHNDNKILWEIISGTGEGNYWCPHKAILSKESSK